VPDAPTPAPATQLDRLVGAAGGSVLRMAGADVGATREVQRRRRWLKLTAAVWVVVGLLWARALTYDGGGFVPLPTIDPFLLVIIIFFGLLVAMMVGQQLVTPGPRT
jgi:hypothetical protein